MKKGFTVFFALLISVAMWAKEGGKLTSSVTPIDPSETVTLSYDGTGTNFANWEPKCHIHTWLVAKSDQEFIKEYGTNWASCEGDEDYAALPAKVKMTFVSKGKYTISMNIKEFFDVADEDLAKISKIGVIVRAQYEGDNNQTNDLFISVSVPDAPPAPNFYVTGDSALVVDAGVGIGKKWDAAAIPSEKDTLELSLKGGIDYLLKVTVDGTWDTAKGYSDLTEKADGLHKVGGNDNNIGFRLNNAGKVKVIYTGSIFKLIGDFYVAPTSKFYVTGDSALVVDAGAGIGKKWNPAAIPSEKDTIELSLKGGVDYLLKVTVDGSWDTAMGYDDLTETAEGLHKVGGNDNNIGFRLNNAGKVKVIYNGSGFKLIGDFYVAPTSKFYVTGDSALVVDAGAGIGKKWDAAAIPSEKDTLELSLKEGVDYLLKVTVDGSWDTAMGYDDLTETAEGLHKVGGNDNNIGFRLATAGEVKVIYKENLFKLIGDFYVKKAEKKIVKLVPSEEWQDANAKFAAWIWGKELDESQWTSFFKPVSAGNDTLQAEILSTADSIDFVRFSPKATKPTWDKVGDYVVVWNEAKDTIDWIGLTATIKGWNQLSWKPVEVPCSGYGLLVDGEQYIDGKHDVSKTEWTEYYLRSVHLTAGQTLKIKNKCNDDAWVISKFAETSYELDIKDGSYVIAEDGDYDFYLKLIYENNEIFISKAGTYTTAVRSQCTDVLMQAFFNESYNNSAPGVSDSWALGVTKWDTLLSQADTLGKYFDLIWLPPSANGDGMGYHPKNYGNQSSNWGSATELTDLINALHDAGAKVVADIVINHCQSSTGWMGFPQFDFGTYGKFQPVGAWICQNDEVNSDPSSDSKGQATGPYDDGENWSGARDWAHSNVEVQAMFKAYLKWMRNVVGYDGFRYDKGDGFNNWHHDNYNKAAGPYIAFMECYSGTDEIQYRIGQANYNLMALDFDTKWHVFNSIAGWDYSRDRGDGLLGRGWGRYAVEFIDSHDWFLRGDNENEFGGRGNSLTENMKCRLLQANAYLLSMPGVPCVFYPHWKKYDGFIKPMIQARKLAGVHSESEVKDVYATTTGYQATIVGKDGFLILCLGDKAHQNFDGFTCMASYYETNDCNMGKDASYQIWVKRTTPLPTGLENGQSDEVQCTKGEKFMKDGKLFIRLGDKVYDVLGQTIK